MEANLMYAAISGLVGAVVMTGLIYAVKVDGKRLDIPYILGTPFAGIENTNLIYGVGIILHLIIGAAWGMLYVFLLAAMVVTPNWPVGILWGFGHGIFIGALMGTLSETHPHIGKGKKIKDPGMLGRRWSTKMPYWLLTLHVIYGVCTLLIYHRLMVN